MTGTAVHSAHPHVARSAPVLEVSAAGIFAVGDAVPARNGYHLTRHLTDGYIPSQCYVFKNGGTALVMDGGLALHRDTVAAGLAALLKDGAEKRAFLASRWEPDAIINLPMAVEQLGLRKVYAIGELSPLDFFTGLEEAAARASLGIADSGLQLASIMPGDVLEIGALRLEVLRTSLRLLLTNWFYERTTETLFCADAWCLLAALERPELVRRAPLTQEISPKSVERALLSKFDWLIGADPSKLIDDLKALQAEKGIARVCPTLGGIIEGPAAVAEVFESTCTALKTLSRMSRSPVLENFDWGLCKA